MSEIKGTLLTMLLVLTIFGAIGGVLYTAFNNSATTISNKITAADSTIVSLK